MHPDNIARTIVTTSDLTFGDFFSSGTLFSSDRNAPGGLLVCPVCVTLCLLRWYTAFKKTGAGLLNSGDVDLWYHCETAKPGAIRPQWRRMKESAYARDLS